MSKRYWASYARKNNVPKLYPGYVMMHSAVRNLSTYQQPAYLWLLRSKEVSAAALFYEDCTGDVPEWSTGDPLPCAEDEDIDACLEAKKMSLKLKMHHMDPSIEWSPSKLYNELGQMDKAWAESVIEEEEASKKLKHNI